MKASKNNPIPTLIGQKKQRFRSSPFESRRVGRSAFSVAQARGLAIARATCGPEWISNPATTAEELAGPRRVWLRIMQVALTADAEFVISTNISSSHSLADLPGRVGYAASAVGPSAMLVGLVGR